MQNNNQPTSLLSLNPAIDFRPLTVEPDTEVIDAIAMMGKAHSSCVLPSLNVPLDSVLMNQARASSVLVVEGKQLIGVFTQTDAIKILASGISLTGVKMAEVITQPAIALTLSNKHDIFSALSLLRQHQILHLPVVNETNQVVGVITPTSLRQVLQPADLLKSQCLAEVMIPSVIHALVTTSALNLARLMVEHQVSYVVITEINSENEVLPVGIVTEQQIVQLQSLELDLSDITAHTIMNAPLLCLSSSTSVLVANWEMQQQQVHELVVSANQGVLLGIVTPTSFLQRLDLTQMSSAIEDLQQSITKFEVQKAELLHNGNTHFIPQVQVSPIESLEQLQLNRLLNAIALRIRESLNLDEILHTAVTEVRQFLQTDRVIIYRFNPDLSGTVVVESAASGWQPVLGTTVQDSCFGKNYAQAYKEGRVQVTEDIYTAGLTQCHIDILVVFDIRANLVVPIIQGEKLWGLLCAYHCSGPRHWRQFEVDLLKQLSTHIAIAIQQSELYEQVQTELTERKRAEEQIKVSLKEKEILLKEIHHRVKNNLQIISSLLKLQSSYIKDNQFLDMFKDSQNRIRSMALIHEKLYQSKDLSSIDFSEYVRDLASNLLRSYGTKSQAVALEININNIWLSIDTAIPCGLIINELASNSLKHAFKGSSKKNIISINIESQINNSFNLSFSDNGIGLPQGLDLKNTESLGLELVYTLAEQLDGSIELEQSGGTTFKITFREVGNTPRFQ